MPSVRGEIRIEAGRADVWRVLADFGGIERWSPVVLRSFSTTEETEDVGAARHCDLFPRGTVEEQVVEWDQERYLGIHVDPNGPFASQQAEFDLTDAGLGTQVSMTITFELGPDMQDRIERVEAALESAIQGSLAGLKHHLETGNVVGTEIPGSA